MTKIQMTTPLVEMDGDEMTRILWKMIKDELLLPYIDLNTEYYDLGLAHRNDTDDQVTIDAAEATKKYGVAVKCATITPNHARMDEYDLKKMYKSPNGTIRAILDGTVFRAPIVVKGIEPCVRNWKKPITLARHAYGDIYKNTEMYIDKPGKVELVYTSEDGEEKRALVQDFKAPGVAMGMHNMEASIESFARSCFNYALDTKQDVWFGAKDTISKTYDAKFKQVFQTIFDEEFKEKFEEAGLTYFYSLIDDIVARVMKAEGGFICKFIKRIDSQIIFLKPDSLYICTFFQFFLGKTAVLTRGSIFFKCFLLIHCYLFFEDLVLAGACRRICKFLSDIILINTQNIYKCLDRRIYIVMLFIIDFLTVQDHCINLLTCSEEISVTIINIASLGRKYTALIGLLCLQKYSFLILGSTGRINIRNTSQQTN